MASLHKLRGAAAENRLYPMAGEIPSYMRVRGRSTADPYSKPGGGPYGRTDVVVTKRSVSRAFGAVIVTPLGVRGRDF